MSILWFMKTLNLKQFLINFCRCGIAGWCLEVMFTSVDSIMAGDWRLMGRTSLIMFPIYGMGALLGPISGMMDSWLSDLPGFEEASRERISPLALAIRHGLLFMVMIFIAEYVTGILSLIHISGGSSGICRAETARRIRGPGLPDSGRDRSGGRRRGPLLGRAGGENATHRRLRNCRSISR